MYLVVCLTVLAYYLVSPGVTVECPGLLPNTKGWRITQLVKRRVKGVLEIQPTFKTLIKRIQ
jgi:hypothetical protein